MPATLALLATMVLAGPPAQSSDIQISQCVISLIQDVSVPAREAGELTELIGYEGMVVEKGTLLGQIDDKDAQARMLVAEAEKQKAQYLGNTTASVQAARATAEVAKAEMEQTMKINSILDDAISEFDERRRVLTWERSKAELEIADIQHNVDLLDIQARGAQLTGVQNEIQRRRIESPVTGVVVKRIKNLGEWVTAGDPVYRVVQMDRLKVEALLDARNYAIEDILGRDVTIKVSGAGNRPPLEIKSTINFVNPVLTSSRQFVIKTEFVNPVKNGIWQVNPGQDAEMVVHLKKE